MQVPKEHQAVMPYLVIDGAQKFIDFTTKVFQAETSFHQLREDEKTIMHAEIRIGGSTIMLTEATGQWKATYSNLFVYVNSADETYKTALENGAATVMEVSDQSYGRTCGIQDPAGNVWWITSV